MVDSLAAIVTTIVTTVMSVADVLADVLAGVAPDATGDTINDFFPEQRSLSDCVGVVQRPGCGSQARGGWRQGVILLSILAGLGFITWRIIVASRRARRDDPAAT